MAVVVKVGFVSADDPDHKNYRTVKFDLSRTVADALSQFGAKQSMSNLDDYGFFLELPGGRGGQWLQPEKNLGDYPLDSSSVLEFKKRTRLLRIELLDGTHKTMSIDGTWPCTDIIQRACKKFGVDNPEEFALQQKGSRDIDWLDSEKTLHEQNVKDEDVVVLRKKFFTGTEHPDDMTIPALHVYYVQLQRSVSSGALPCTLSDALHLAGLQMQVEVGNHDPSTHTASTVETERLVAPMWRRMRNIEEDIVKHHKQMFGLTDEQAKRKYLNLCMKLRTYGVSLFSVKERTVGSKKFTFPILYGITHDSVLRLDADTKDVISQHPYSNLKRWAATPHTLTLDWGKHASEYTVVKTVDGPAMSELIAGYIDIAVHKRPDLAAKIVASKPPVGVQAVAPAPASKPASVIAAPARPAATPITPVPAAAPTVAPTAPPVAPKAAPAVPTPVSNESDAAAAATRVSELRRKFEKL